MKEVILKTKDLTKKYKEFIALNNVNISINKGDIYGLIGRNGAGKTTLMKMIISLTNKTSGSITLFHNAKEDKKRIGSLIENPAFFPNLNAYDNLKYYAIQKGINDKEKIYTALKLVDLDNAKNKKYKNFSLGMKQRLGIALAILDKPDFIILDEPINGLDPIGISDMRKVFYKLNKEYNITILISSHILSELYTVANRFCIINQGKIIKELSKEELDLECSKCIVIKTNNSKKAATVLNKSLATSNYKIISNSELRLYDYLEDSAKVNKILVENKIDVNEIYEKGLSLEDYFKSLLVEEV